MCPDPHLHFPSGSISLPSSLRSEFIKCLGLSITHPCPSLHGISRRRLVPIEPRPWQRNLPLHCMDLTTGVRSLQCPCRIFMMMIDAFRCQEQSRVGVRGHESGKLPNPPSTPIARTPSTNPCQKFSSGLIPCVDR